MKRKHMKKRAMSLLLVFSMVVSLFAGQTVTKKEASAASNATINFGNLQESQDGTYYTYPETTINYSGPKYFNYLTVSVDSGYLQLTSTSVNNRQGKGVLSGSNMNNFYEALSTNNRYEAVYFDFSSNNGDPASKEQLQEFLRSIRFTTEADKDQNVSVFATTENDEDLRVTIDDQVVQLRYFNGHYYGYVKFDTDDKSWSEAYRESKTDKVQFCGVQGYLATLTTKAEDRFILESFDNGWNSHFATLGWIGCTRAKLAAGSSYSDAKTRWQSLDNFSFDNCQKDFIWRWVSGPEAGDEFGYQNHACGDGTGGDGGFVTKDGQFSNWNKSDNIEPNGGFRGNSNEREAYGYYGKYQYGRWNDAKDSGGNEYGIDGYYVEFGGHPGDDEKFENELGQITISSTKNSGGSVTAETPAPPEKIAGKPEIKNKNKDADGKDINEPGTVLVADIKGITPEDSHDTLTYQWGVIENGEFKPIEKDGDGPNFVLTEDTLDKELAVIVTGHDKYTGDAQSDPYDTTATKKAEAEKIPIAGKPIIMNETTDDYGNEINKEGTVLTAEISNVTPVGSHDTLTYQWYIQEMDGSLTPIDGATEKSLILTTNTIDKDLVVKAFGNGDYIGEVESDPYDTTRTNAGIIVDPDDIQKDPTIPDDIKDKIDENSDKRVLVITPTDPDTIYAVMDENRNVLTELPTVKVSADGVVVDDYPPTYYEEDYQGYYEVDLGEKLIVTVEKNKTYIIHEVKRPKANTTENTEVISPVIPDSSIKTEGDNKGTEDKADDTISIIIDPADTEYKYAVLKKEDGKYVEVPVTKDKDGNYTYDPNSSEPWSDSGENKVTFTELPADGTYKIVAVPKDSDDTIIKDLTPDQITGGSKDIHEDVPPYTPAPSPAAPTAPTSPTTPQGITGNTFTQEELDKAAQFVKEHATDPNGTIITVITDITRDIITSGETEWLKMTDTEKAAVNAKLKESGCPYTYEELLNMAKAYKIPGFKLKKDMKKKTKSKLKLVKCKGATIVCTSTNKKVATVNKKGVISAKKVGKATLTITATKGQHTNRLVINVVVKKKFKNAKELKKFKSNKIKTPTILIAKKRKLKKSTKLRVYDLEKGAKVKYKAFNKKVLKLTKKGKYTGKKKGSSLVRVTIKQNDKTYLLYVYVSIFKK